ncbi:MAG: HAD-IC family P-type ATPase [Campylobacterales bacterium]|nr:HAD-IC family P-type ATPase [Campylobacterales bacterium]
MDVFVFDKTGTLTTDDLIVSDIFGLNGFEKLEVLKLAATVEQRVVHPIAKAITTKAIHEGLELPNIEDSTLELGRGLRYSLDGKEVLVGSHLYLIENEILVKNKDTILEKIVKDGNSFVWVAFDKKVAGVIVIASEVREGLHKTMDELKKIGASHLAIISGDHEQPTKKLADELGMDSYYFDISPQDKGNIIENLQRDGKKVCFIGDGINDTLAMRQADVSISLKGASSLATDMAQIILIDVKFENLVKLVNLSKELDSNLKISMGLSLTSTGAILSGLFFFKMGILGSLLVDNGFSLAALLNSLRPLKDIKVDTNILNDFDKKREDMRDEVKK